MDEIVDSAIGNFLKYVEFIDDTMMIGKDSWGMDIIRVKDICYISIYLESTYFRITIKRNCAIESKNTLHITINFISSIDSNSIDFEKLGQVIKHRLIKIIFEHKRKTIDNFQEKLLERLESIEDKLQAIVYAPGSSLFQEIKKERDALVEKLK